MSDSCNAAVVAGKGVVEIFPDLLSRQINRIS
jgi:hypothetical protein